MNARLFTGQRDVQVQTSDAQKVDHGVVAQGWWNYTMSDLELGDRRADLGW